VTEEPTRVVLQRQKPEAYGTFGQMFRDGRQLCVTCEPAVPIPAGTYTCVPHNGPKFQNVWELQGVPGHTAILIHNGNTVDDTLGCILVGSTFGRVDGRFAVVDSRATLDAIRATLPPTFTLDIRDYPIIN
jgi:hypothetical protein